MSIILLRFGPLLAAEGASAFNIKIGDQVNVASDRGLRNVRLNTFEALGNVVITDKDEAIYGERATLDLKNNQVDVVGNVRYVGPMMTMYGQELSYNMITKVLTLKNGKVSSQGYVVWGEQLSRISENVIIGTNAEYTTCTDCPESWTVYGEKITLTLGEYIHIKPAIVKSKGSPIFYSPYVIFPVKKGRQTGLLFPQFSLSLTKGLSYAQPFFWAINDSMDATITPKINDRRGFSGELEFRQVLGESKWYEINTLGARDKVYLPNDEKRLDVNKDPDPSNTHWNRYAVDIEEHHQFGNNFNHHMVLSKTRDYDMMSDFPNFMGKRVVGSELPNWAFIDVKSSFLYGSVEGTHNHNLLVPSPTAFDKSYVQTLPRISLSASPTPLLQSSKPFLQNISVGADSYYSRFRQNHFEPRGTWFRNIDRVEAYPYMNWTFGSLGPFTFATSMRYEYQNYQIPKNRRFENVDGSSLTKEGNIIMSEMYFEVEKIFGPAYKDILPIEKVIDIREEEQKQKQEQEAEIVKCLKYTSSDRFACSQKQKEYEKESLKNPSNSATTNRLKNGGLVGELPERGKLFTDDFVSIEKDSYRHSLFFNVRHYYTANQSMRGNERLNLQFRKTEGLFDSNDSPRDLRATIGSNETKTDISMSNTLEFRLLNSLFSKHALITDPMLDRRYLTDNFSYSKLAYFNISQGLELNKDRSGDRYPTRKHRFTRLYSATGFPVGRWSFGLSDYYFYIKKTHIFTSSVSRAFDYGNITFSWNYNSVVNPPDETWAISGNVKPFANWTYNWLFAYDQVKNHYKTSSHTIAYSPANNCWMTSLTYATEYGQMDHQKTILFNILINFGDQKYISLLEPNGVKNDS